MHSQRKLPQAVLAARLGLSQSRFSQVERGDGSFTAEQLIEILRIFNVPISHFVELDSSDEDTALQNALARLGASHLRESPKALLSTRHEDLELVVRDALVSGSPRLVTALAPVLVANIDKIRFDKWRVRFTELGLERRLSWLLDNVRHALAESSNRRLNRRASLRYGRALVLLNTFLEGANVDLRANQRRGRDVLDADIRSDKSLQQTWSTASEISKRWDVVTALQPEDFRAALEDADVAA